MYENFKCKYYVYQQIQQKPTKYTISKEQSGLFYDLFSVPLLFSEDNGTSLELDILAKESLYTGTGNAPRNSIITHLLDL